MKAMAKSNMARMMHPNTTPTIPPGDSPDDPPDDVPFKGKRLTHSAGLCSVVWCRPITSLFVLTVVGY